MKFGVYYDPAEDAIYLGPVGRSQNYGKWTMVCCELAGGAVIRLFVTTFKTFTYLGEFD